MWHEESQKEAVRYFTQMAARPETQEQAKLSTHGHDAMGVDDKVERICVLREFQHYQLQLDFKCHVCGTPVTYGLYMCLNNCCQVPVSTAGLEAQIGTVANLDKANMMRERLNKEKLEARVLIPLSTTSKARQTRRKRTKIAVVRTVAHTDWGTRGDELPTLRERMEDLENEAGTPVSSVLDNMTYEECLQQREREGTFPIDTQVPQKRRKQLLNPPGLMNRWKVIQEKGFMSHVSAYTIDHEYKASCKAVGIGRLMSFWFVSRLEGDLEEKQHFFDELDVPREHEISRNIHGSTMGRKKTADEQDRLVYDTAMAQVGQKRKQREVELATVSDPQNPSAASSSRQGAHVQEVRGGKAQGKAQKGESAIDAVIRQNQANWSYDGRWLQGDYTNQPQMPAKRKNEKGHGGGKRHKGGSKGK